ncbi:MAPEG family protein [Litoreibacter ponti]|uniref:MAPEG family protein n=1 Tax=Litoreibacter ponti TaxID=1510457 RepID=A0A2T6BM74_9RHOB|nr:MAPEG family protein [Litoreibacter ponti]
MTPDLIALALAGLLQVIQFGIMSVACNLDVGPGKTMSARDQSRLGGSLEDQLSDKPARLFPAFENHFEGLIMFTLVVIVVELSGQNTAFTAACAWTYLCARILYVPAHYFGLRPWRSLAWTVGFSPPSCSSSCACDARLARSFGSRRNAVTGPYGTVAGGHALSLRSNSNGD